MLVASENNLTDFAIELDCYTDRRYDAYECQLSVVIKWKKFARDWKDFSTWYEVKGSSPTLSISRSSRKPSHEFLRTGFDGIDRDFRPPVRHALWVANEQELDDFIDQSIADLDGKVGAWIERWFSWASALKMMDDNEQLCGAWRNTAYFCLLEQVHGREAACTWISGIDANGWPKLLAAQVEYLQSQVCGMGAIQA